MIELVLQGAGEKARALDGPFDAVPVERPDDGASGTGDRRGESGQAEAAVLFHLHAVALDEFRVDQREQFAPTAPDAEVDDADPERDANLRRGQADPRRRVHRVDHVVDERSNLPGDVAHGNGLRVQGRVAELDEGTQHYGVVSGAGARRRATRPA
jgi:hypothetical protein